MPPPPFVVRPFTSDNLFFEGLSNDLMAASASHSDTDLSPVVIIYNKGLRIGPERLLDTIAN